MDEELVEYKNIFSRVGMSYITDHIGAPYKKRVAEKTGILINTSAQPNSNPHFGTITTLMCVFAIAEELRDYFEKPVRIVFDMLENAADRKFQGVKEKVVKGKKVQYQISLADSEDEYGVSVLDRKMESFYQIFDFLKRKTKISMEIRSYAECQKDPSFRSALLQIYNRMEEFKGIISIDYNGLRLRFPCPECKWIDKKGVFTETVSGLEEGIVFKSFCPDHGAHTAKLSKKSDDYFDTNTPLRALAKAMSLIEFEKRENWVPIMIDGRDWTGRWDRHIHMKGLDLLGYRTSEFPERIFTPNVTDYLGAKLSKSLYVDDFYDYLPAGFADMNNFLEIYGWEGMEILWKEIRKWATDPAYIERDAYTVKYFELLLSGNLDNSEIKG